MPFTTANGNVTEMLKTMVPDESPTEILSGDPKLHYNELINAKRVEAGVWSSSVGKWEINPWGVEEIFVVQEGRVRLTDSDGNVTELGPGDAFYCDQEWSGTWETLEELKKFYVILHND